MPLAVPKAHGRCLLGCPSAKCPADPQVTPASLPTPSATSVTSHGLWARRCFSMRSSGGTLGCAELLPLVCPGSSSHQEMEGISVKENKWLAGKKGICH